MDSYSQAIYALDSTPRSNSHRAEVTSLAVWLLPNFRAVVFAVTLFQVLLLSQGSQTLFRDSDTGWHVRNGETILKTHALPRTDRFSYTRERQPWFAWEWLSDAVFGSAYRLAGLPGVAVLSALAIALTALGVAHLALSLGGNLFFTAGAIVVLLGTTSIHWLARPHIFSWILALLFLGVAEHERHRHGRLGRLGRPSRVLYALPFVAILWANLHGSFLLGPAMLFIYAAGEWLDRRSGKRFAAASLASLLATFINPYGWQLHDHVFSYLQNDYLMDHISEFRSFSFHSPGSLYVELFLLVAVAGTLALLRQRAFGPAILGLAMLHISLYSARHLPTAAVLLLPLCVAALTREAKGFAGLRPMLEYSERLLAIDRRIRSIVPAMLALAIAIGGVTALARSERVGFNPEVFPVRAAGFLENAKGRIFTKDQWGGYLIYRFAGRAKVFIDGRSDFYGQNLLESYAQINEVKPGWDTALKQYDVRYVLVPPDNALASALQLSKTWKRVYSDWVAAVYERVG